MLVFRLLKTFYWINILKISLVDYILSFLIIYMPTLLIRFYLLSNLFTHLYNLKVNKNLKFKHFIAKVLIYDQLDILQIWMV